MREIKLRYWHKKKKIMLEGPLDFWLKASGETGALPSGGVWLEFTGLKDKNGKEIFESDILKIHNRGLWKIVFNGGGFSINPIEENQDRYYGMLTYSESDKNNKLSYEIVGNIWENPNLLKEKS